MNTLRSYRRMHGRRSAFTVLELLTVVFVIGVLLSISLPAVQRARLMANRLQCVNNLRQIGIASHLYHDAFRHLPDPNHSVIYQLFPYLELQAWHGQILLNKWHPVLLCPLDNLHREGSSPFSYLMPNVSCRGCGDAMFPTGRFPADPVRFRDATDGLSLTVLFSERRASLLDDLPLQQRRESCLSDPVRCLWRLGRIFGPGEDEAFVAACNNAADRRVDIIDIHSMDSRVYWASYNPAYSHLLPPNSPACYLGYPAESVFSHGATSAHTGGVNVLLCDGSVRFAANSIDIKTWWSLGTRNGNEAHVEF